MKFNHESLPTILPVIGILLSTVSFILACISQTQAQEVDATPATSHSSLHKAIEQLYRRQCGFDATLTQRELFVVSDDGATTPFYTIRCPPSSQECPEENTCPPVEVIEPITIKYSFIAPVERVDGSLLSCENIERYFLQVTFDGIQTTAKAYVVDSNGIFSAETDPVIVPVDQP